MKTMNLHSYNKMSDSEFILLMRWELWVENVGDI